MEYRPSVVTMSLSGIWCLLLLAVVTLASHAWAAPQRRYSSKYDYINPESIINNNRVITKFIQCLLGEGVCTPEGRDLKESIPKALEGGCDKCTLKEERLVREAAKYIKKNRPDDWKRILDKIDPDKIYSEKIEKFVSE